MKLKLTLLLLIAFLDVSGQDTILQISSSVQFPFRLTFKTLEESTNRIIQGRIFADTLYTDNDNDQLKCIVWKNGNIKITPLQNNVLKVDVPLKVWAEKGIGTLGIYNYQSTQFQLTMSFHMVYNLFPDWKLRTKTLGNGFVWTQKPILQVAGISVPITSIIEGILSKKQKDYSELIDKQISESNTLQNDMLNFWNTLKIPELVSEEYKTWLRITPISMEATPLIQDAQSIQSTFKLNIVSETFVGNAPTPLATTINLPPLKYQKIIPSALELYTMVHIPYQEMNDIAAKRFLHQVYEFENGKYKVETASILLSNEANQLKIVSQLTGSFNGQVTIIGIPYYDEIKKSIRLKNVEFDMKTKNLFHKTISWIFNGKIERSVEENFEIPTQESMELARQSTQTSFNQVRNGMKMSGRIDEMRPFRIFISNNALHLIILTRGFLQVEM